MSQLTVYHQQQPAQALTSTTDGDEIARQLNAIGVRFERWHASQPLRYGAAPDEVIAAYREPIDRLMREQGYQSVDVVSLTPDHPNKVALREKFLSEHTHSEDEVRFFVEGKGLFCLHIGEHVYAVLCEKGDLISVPNATPHWFDMGTQPHFACIRLFTNPEGWVAQYTGNKIADDVPNLEIYA
jgi:1,2-dihydroxy-3-keto-5-methylthiopentene dioxygenase